MGVFTRLSAYFLALSGLDILSTWLGAELGGLGEANPLLARSAGGVNYTLLLTLNPAAALLFAAVIAWLASGETGRASAIERVTPSVFAQALSEPGRSYRPPVRRAQIFAGLYVGLAIFVFPILNNIMQVALPPGMLGGGRNFSIALVCALGALAAAHLIARPLLASALGARTSP